MGGCLYDRVTALEEVVGLQISDPDDEDFENAAHVLREDGNKILLVLRIGTVFVLPLQDVPDESQRTDENGPESPGAPPQQANGECCLPLVFRCRSLF